MSCVSLKTSINGRGRIAAAAAAVRRPGGSRRLTGVPRAAVAEEVDTSALISTLKLAVKEPRSVPGPTVLQSILALEKQKIKLDDKLETLVAKGTHWKLVVLAGKDAVIKASKGDTSKGVYYSPFVAAQNFDAVNNIFENGVFLGNVGYLTFTGPFYFDGKTLTFDVTTMKLGLGPLNTSFTLKPESPLSSLPEDPKEASTAAKRAKLPFFNYIYLDDEILVGRGRSGGLAVWEKTDVDWEAENGVLKVYADK